VCIERLVSALYAVYRPDRKPSPEGLHPGPSSSDSNPHFHSSTLLHSAAPHRTAPHKQGLKDGEAGAYILEYDRFRTWAMGSFDDVKSEFLAVSFPLYVHSYINLIKRGASAAQVGHCRFCRTCVIRASYVHYTAICIICGP